MRRRKGKTLVIRAAAQSAPGGAVTLLATAQIDIAADAEGKPTRRPTFTIDAYHGGAMNVGFRHPVVIDLAGLRHAAQIPVLLDHDSTQIVGQSTDIRIGDGKVAVAGVVTGDDFEPAQRVLAHARKGFKWAASVGVSSAKFEVIAEGQTTKVNGRDHEGPLYVIRAGRLGEVSFVAGGADERAAATVAARGAGRDTGNGNTTEDETDMTFNEWLTAKGFDPNTLSAAQRATLKAAFERESAGDAEAAPAAASGGGSATATPASTAATGASVTAAAVTATVPAHVAELRAESARVAQIQAACARHPEIAAQAIAEGWQPDRARQAVVQASRPRVPVRSGSSAAITATIAEAAIRLGSAEPARLVEADYDEPTLDAAQRIRRLTLRGLIDLCCRMEGAVPPALSDDVGAWVRAGFSTTSLAGILGNTAHKMMLAAFASVPSVVRPLFRKLTTSDFKSHTGYRLGGKTTLEEVGSGGELKHGTLEESSFSFRVKTFGEYIALTRTQWINDDLGAFTQIPLRIGRGAMLTIEKAGMDLLKANTGNFFHANNLNLISGADSALGLTGLDKAVATMRKLKDDQGEPIGVEPRFLLVPPDLEGEANRLFTSDGMIATGVANASKREAAANTHKGRFPPRVSPYLSAAGEWYLFADPNDVAAFGLAFLNGVEEPVIEETPLPPDTLGQAWRGYIDFGVCQVEKQGAVKSAGQ